MTLTLSCFDLADETQINDILNRLKSRFTVEDHPVHVVTRIYLDTFDWRLFAAGLQLQCEIADKTHTFTLRNAGKNQIIASLGTDNPLRMIEDFPESAVKKRLAPVIEMRALLPKVSLYSRLHPLMVLNTDHKIILKLSIERNHILKKSTNAGALVNRNIVLQPIRGYQKQFDAVDTFLRDEIHLPIEAQDTYQQALSKLNIQPGGYSSKLDIPLEPTMRADLATKKILLHLLRTMQTNENGVMDNVDTEFLHDFRVACRRTRSAIGQIKAVFPNKIVDRFKHEFAWLQNVTGPTRDLDVYLLNFNDYKNSVPEHLQNALQPLHDYLQEQQRTEQKKLVSALETKHYERLINKWQQFLQVPAPNRASLENAARPVSEVAGERIWKMYKRVIHEGEAITDQSPPEELHELRKSCKKLRYLMEFFSNLYPAQELSQLIKALKQLQGNLGDYNDLHVQIDSLKRYSKQMMEHNPPPAETFLAMGSLVESLDQKQRSLRQEFHAQFQQFNAPQYHTLFQQLFTYPNPTDIVPS